MSKSEKLEKYNLHAWMTTDDGTNLKTPAEGYMEHRCHKGMESDVEEGNQLCHSLCHGISKIQWAQLKDFLCRNYPSHHAQMKEEIDIDGFARVGRKRGTFFDYWKFGVDLKDHESYRQLQGIVTDNSATGSSRPLNELLAPDTDVWQFSQDERSRILRHWENQLRQDWVDEIVVRAQDYQNEKNKLDAVRSEAHRRLLEKVDVIGLTTTGLARYAPLLDRIESKILICEEAGEVLEVASS
jgi:hypothetical protein